MDITFILVVSVGGLTVPFLAVWGGCVAARWLYLSCGLMKKRGGFLLAYAAPYAAVILGLAVVAVIFVTGSSGWLGETKEISRSVSAQWNLFILCAIFWPFLLGYPIFGFVTLRRARKRASLRPAESEVQTRQ